MNPLQAKQFEMLKVFVDICDKYNLNYILVGGTCLGAIRHKGFIPWDDDIDVGMLREDYEEFLRVAPKELDKEKYFLQNYKTEPNFVYGFSKIRDNNTTYVEDFFADHDIHHGVWIDILPIDGYTDKNIEPNKLKGRITKFILHIWLSYMPSLFRKFRRKTFFKDLLFNFLAVLFYPCNIAHYHQKALDRMAKKYPTNKATLVGNHLYGFTGKIEALPPEVYRDTIKVQFEDIICRVPKDYDTYLKCLYGDYMKLPKEEDRIGHHHDKGFSLTVGYKEYLYGEKKSDK